MGFSPEQIGDMSWWQFNAAVMGFNEFNGAGEGSSTLSQTEKDEIWEWMGSRPEAPLTFKRLQ